MIFLLLVILIVIKNFSLIYTASALRVTPPSLLQKLTDGNNRSRYWY